MLLVLSLRAAQQQLLLLALSLVAMVPCRELLHDVVLLVPFAFPLSGTPTGRSGKLSSGPQPRSWLLLARWLSATSAVRWAWMGPFSLFRLGWKQVLGEEAHAVSFLLAPPVSGSLKPFYCVGRHSAALNCLCDLRLITQPLWPQSLRQ